MIRYATPYLQPCVLRAFENVIEARLASRPQTTGILPMTAEAFRILP